MFSSRTFVLVLVLLCSIVGEYGVIGEASSNAAPKAFGEEVSLDNLPSRSVTSLLLFLGPLFFISLQISSILTVNRVMASKSVGGLSSLPFSSLFVNSVVWTLYGITIGDLTVFVPNFTGILAGAYCMYVFYYYAREKPQQQYTIACSLCIVITWLSFVGYDSWIGPLGCMLSVAVSAAPLAVVKTVIAEKSTASLPFESTLVLWLNCASWLSYGFFIVNDPMIYGPNLLNIVLVSIQLSLFVIYGFASTKDRGKQVEIA